MSGVSRLPLSATGVSPGHLDPARPFSNELLSNFASQSHAFPSRTRPFRKQSFLPIDRENTRPHMNPVSSRRGKPANRNLARPLKNPHQLSLRIHLRPSRLVLNRPQRLYNLQIISSRDNSQRSLTRSRHKLFNRQPFRDSVGDTKPSKTSLVSNSRIELSPLHPLNPCLHISPQRFRAQ